jgi:hypothetical protein
MKTASVRHIERSGRFKAIVLFISFVLSIPRQSGPSETPRSGYSIRGDSSPAFGFAILIPPAMKNRSPETCNTPVADALHSAVGLHFKCRPALSLVLDVGGTELLDWGLKRLSRNVLAEQSEKRGVPRVHGIHASWELLSPDLRCFC